MLLRRRHNIDDSQETAKVEEKQSIASAPKKKVKADGKPKRSE